MDADCVWDRIDGPLTRTLVTCLPFLAVSFRSERPGGGWCVCVVDVAGVAVSPVWEHPFVNKTNDEVGGQQLHDRLAELEDENRRLRALVDQLRRAARLAADVLGNSWETES